MTKTFKEWEKKFSDEEIQSCRQLWLRMGASQEDINLYTRWPEQVSDWPQEFVQACVYTVSDAHEWQRFRVSMKGLTTKEKLYMLHNRFASRVHMYMDADPSGPDWVTYKIEKCRIDNYIGALVRGGQLNGNYEVVK